MHHYINISQPCMQQNELSTGRKLPVIVLCNYSSPCREVMKSCKLLQPIAVGWLYLFRTGGEEHHRLWQCSLPTLGFFKICRFWYSSVPPSNWVLQLSPERIICIRQVDSLNVTSSHVHPSFKLFLKTIIMHELYILNENT